MTTSREFLESLSSDATRLGQFILDPDAIMSDAGLSDEDKATIRSGFTGIIFARMSGVSAVEAFRMTLQPPIPPQHVGLSGVPAPSQAPPIQMTPPQVPPPQFMFQTPPLIAIWCPQFYGNR
jgi:hypothetical protein